MRKGLNQQQNTKNRPRRSRVQSAVIEHRTEISRVKRTEMHIAGLALPQQVPEEQEIADMNWLSSSIPHDLRNPLAAIHAGAETLLDVDSLPSDAKRLAMSIYRASRCVRELLTDLATIASGNRPTM